MSLPASTQTSPEGCAGSGATPGADAGADHPAVFQQFVGINVLFYYSTDTVGGRLRREQLARSSA